MVLAQVERADAGLAASTPVGETAWYQERLFWYVLLITVAIYLPRLTTLTVRGEESRRAVIAREMIETGDWIVPRTQGVVRLSRPPLQNWLIAATSFVSGGMNAWAIRLPGFACTLATAVLIYWYARRKLQPSAAFIAAVAYGSLLQVVEQGRTGETEPVFTLMMSAALLLWHGGLMCGWKPEVYWSVGAACAGLATLTKGLQGPLYFFASTWAYLILTGQWRWLLSRGHALGIASFAAVVGAWQIPFLAMMGWEDSWLMYFTNVAHRFHDRRWSTFVLHLLTYPPSILVGCLAPWSLLYLGYTDRGIREQLGARRDMLVFLAVAVLVCFPSVWIPPEARPRYFMPLFPCFAVAMGLTAELMMRARNAGAIRLWTIYVRGGSTLMVAAAIGLLAWSLIGTGNRTPAVLPTVIYGACAIALASLLWRQDLLPTPQSMTRGVALIAAFLGLTYIGPIINNQRQRSEDLPTAMTHLHKSLPDHVRLVSFDHLHHLFLLEYGESVPLLPWPTSSTDVPADVEYFSVHVGGTEEPDLPFAWEPVASLSMDRNHHDVPERRIVVGRITDRNSVDRASSALARRPQNQADADQF